MRKSRLTVERILQALRQSEAATPVVEICGKMAVTETTFHWWIERYTGVRLVWGTPSSPARSANRRAENRGHRPSTRTSPQKVESNRRQLGTSESPFRLQLDSALWTDIGIGGSSPTKGESRGRSTPSRAR